MSKRKNNRYLTKFWCNCHFFHSYRNFLFEYFLFYVWQFLIRAVPLSIIIRYTICANKYSLRPLLKHRVSPNPYKLITPRRLDITLTVFISYQSCNVITALLECFPWRFLEGRHPSDPPLVFFYCLQQGLARHSYCNLRLTFASLPQTLLRVSEDRWCYILFCESLAIIVGAWSLSGEITRRQSFREYCLPCLKICSNFSTTHEFLLFFNSSWTVYTWLIIFKFPVRHFKFGNRKYIIKFMHKHTISVTDTALCLNKYDWNMCLSKYRYS